MNREFYFKHVSVLRKDKLVDELLWNWKWNDDIFFFLFSSFFAWAFSFAYCASWLKFLWVWSTSAACDVEEAVWQAKMALLILWLCLVCALAPVFPLGWAFCAFVTARTIYDALSGAISPPCWFAMLFFVSFIFIGTTFIHPILLGPSNASNNLLFVVLDVWSVKYKDHPRLGNWRKSGVA